jgi:hypothetical protein
MTTFTTHEKNKQWFSATILLRASSILFLGLTIGHMSAYPWTSTNAPREYELRRLMTSVPFEFMGERSPYWNLYFGWGVLVGLLLFALAIILWILPNFATVRPRSTGAIASILAGASVVGAYLSFRFFFIPPFLFFSMLCATLMAASVRLLRRQVPEDR